MTFMTTIKTNRFIVLEGLEGAGKSTALAHIKSWFSQNKPHDHVVFTREPGGTIIAEKIRNLIITNFDNESLSSEAELLLMYAARIQHVKELIIPSLKKGKWVISDRFFWSSFAYQGGGRKIDLSTIETIHHALLGDFKPSFTLFLDLPPEIGLKRIQSRETDRIENEQRDFFIRTREVFQTLAKNDNTCATIDASQSIDNVKKAITKALEKFIKDC